MLFMVIERFRDNDMIPIYQKVRDAGRSLPEGLEYVDSWVEPNFSRCFQLSLAMTCVSFRNGAFNGAGQARLLRSYRSCAARRRRRRLLPT